MRIYLFTNHSFMLYKFRKELIQELLKEHEVTLIMPAGEFVSEFMEMGCKIIDVEMHRRSISIVDDAKLIRCYYKLLKNDRPDMVLTYSIKPNIYAGWAAKKLHIPYCANITGLGTAFQKPLLASFVTMLYKIGFARVKTVFFENESNMKIFLDRHIVKKEKSCLLNGAGVNLEEFAYEDMENSNETRFIFVGRLMKEKGVDELLEAFDRLKDEEKVHLDIVGPFEEDYNDKIKELEKDDHYDYLGFQNDVRPYLRKAHCLVLPSYHEGMANTILEASAMGRCVIASNIPGCKESVEDQISGLLVNVKDANDLYLKMKEFVSYDFMKKQEMGRNARKIMENKFDKKEVVQITIQAILH